jgi:tryptophan 2,3-dioxygenase
MNDSQDGPACPFGHGSTTPNSEYTGPVLPGEGGSDYERYMRVDDLLKLQKDPKDMHHPDEMMFTAVHQSFEIWLKLVLFELDRVKASIDNDDFHTAGRFLRRCRNVIRANTHALAIFDTMVPQEFHEVRRQLGTGSGAESPGFRKLLQTAPTIWPHVESLIDRNDTTLKRVYTEEGHRPDLFVVFEAMTDFDQEVSDWRAAHLSVVKRIIGRDVNSLKGAAVKQLEDDIRVNLWPELWRVREAVTEYEGTSPA